MYTPILGLLFTASAILLGCGAKSDVERMPIQGAVSFQNQPVTEGQIRFIPVGDTKGPVSGAAIRDGAYRMDGRGGVPAGTYRVEIEARRPIPGGKVDPLTPGQTPTEQYLPAKYNLQSDLTMTIESGSGTITKDLPLK